MSRLHHSKTGQSIGLALLLLLSACSWNMPAPQQTVSKPQSNAIGPYPNFSGRLIVIDPSRRWQVSVDWQAKQAASGKLRLSHAFSSTVVDFRWTDSYMEIRDSKFPYWRHIEQQELTEHGIMLPPTQLASILLGDIPSHFHQKKQNTWESMNAGYLIRLHWQSESRKLTISDMKHGRIAKLIIQ